MSAPVSFDRPPASSIRSMRRLIAVPKKLASPVFVGLERIPRDRPLLFVGNHVVYSSLDALLLWDVLHREHGIFLRPLGDHIHFAVPGWGDLLTHFGAVDGTRENCAALMQEGECVLVYPGGAREVAKRKGEAYRLLWGNRLGFAKMAIENRCTIVPFATVGGEEAFDIVLDGDEILESPIGPLLRSLKVRKDAIPPIVTGIGPTPIPRPERFYFQFQPPIRTASFGGRSDDVERCRELRDRVKTSVAGAIDDLLARRARDPDRTLVRRVTRAVVGRRARG